MQLPENAGPCLCSELLCFRSLGNTVHAGANLGHWELQKDLMLCLIEQLDCEKQATRSWGLLALCC